MNRHIMRLGSVVLASLFADMGPAVAQTPDELRAARAQIIGSAIATGPDYTAHSPQAVASGGGFRCRAPETGGMTEAEYEARRRALETRYRQEMDAIQAEQKALPRKRFITKEISHETFQAEVARLQRRGEEAGRLHGEARARLDAEGSRARGAASDHVAIVLQHAPRDPKATIIPFENRQPSEAFVAELNRVLAPFLADCGARAWVTVSHVYRDHFPAGIDVERAYEKPVTAFNYTISSGRLALDPVRNTSSWLATWGLSDDPRFTLASARQSRQASLQADARARGDYRQDHAVAAKRQRGVVYRLDAYWKQYEGGPALDSVRRVFDGDFAGQRDSTAFKAAFFMFGEAWSRRCAAEIPAFARFRVATSEIARTRTYVDGHVEHDYETRVTEVLIDKRFAPQWGDYRPVAGRHLAAATADIARDMGSFSTATTEQFVEAMRKTQRVSLFGRFFRNHACGSATLNQLRENLVRAANGQPSMQQAGLILAGAERESDPPLR